MNEKGRKERAGGRREERGRGRARVGVREYRNDVSQQINPLVYAIGFSSNFIESDTGP